MSTVECLCCLLDHGLPLGGSMGLSSDLPLLRYGRILAERVSRIRICNARRLDFHEQISQITGALYPTPDRFSPTAGIHPIWLLPRSDQGLRHAVAECGEFSIVLSAEAPPQRESELTDLQTAWGSREGADDDDAYRMIRVSQKHQEALEFRNVVCYTQ